MGGLSSVVETSKTTFNFVWVENFTTASAVATALVSILVLAYILEQRKRDKSIKQGAYGKVPILKPSKFEQLMFPDEIMAMIKYKLESSDNSKNHMLGNKEDRFCDEMLGKVSRSFAGVIRQLPEELQIDICIFYLVLRALDTVEDDMTAFDDVKVKIKHLRNFHNVLNDPEWTMDGVGEGDEKYLLQNFKHVVVAYQRLRPESQEVISDITKEMAAGMADYISRDLRQGTKDEKDFNTYCHIVAGLVGHGLSRLFTASGLENEDVAEQLELADSMGRFLQHTNILRDYLEDYVDGRAFWPATVWEQYAPNKNLGDFAEEENLDHALGCLNHLIADAVELIPDCLAYLQLVKHPDVFKFCSIPQVMAIATLTRCYDNPDCFKGVVKIRKGQAAKMVMDSGNMDAVYAHFDNMMTVLGDKARKAKNPGLGNKREQILDRVAKSKVLINELRMQNNASSPAKVIQPIINMVNKFAPVIFLLCMEFLMSKHKSKGFFLRNLDPYEIICVSLSFLSVVLMLCFSGMEFALSSSSKAV